MQLKEDFIAKHGQRFKTQDVIFDENEIGDELFIVISGEVEILKKVGSAHKSLMVLKPGDIFGEMAIVDKEPRSARAVAKTEVLVCALTDQVVENMINQNSSFAKHLLKILTARMRESNQIISDLLTRDRKNMVIGALYSYAKSNRAERTFKGASIEVDDFSQWASGTIGIGASDVRHIVFQLHDEGMLEDSSVSTGHLILSKRFERRDGIRV
jgi:CRP-like cAMP-binding protein